MVVRSQGNVQGPLNGCELSFWDGKNSLEIVMVALHGECTVTEFTLLNGKNSNINVMRVSILPK